MQQNQQFRPNMESHQEQPFIQQQQDDPATNQHFQPTFNTYTKQA